MFLFKSLIDTHANILQWDTHPKSIIDAFVLLLSPYAPHMAEELWFRLGNTESLAYKPFPKVWILSLPISI